MVRDEAARHALALPDATPMTVRIANLARQKVPRSIDFIDQMPRLPTGKLYKKPLRDRYWAGRASRIV